MNTTVKSLCLLALSLALTACAESPARQAEMGNNSCAKVAAVRAADASYNGFDAVLQQKIYDRTYKDCVAGERRSSMTVILSSRH